MIEINNQDEMEKYHNKETNEYIFEDDVRFNCDIFATGDIDALDITAINIYTSGDITANIIYTTGDTTARNVIKVHKSTIRDINASNIIAKSIDANNIKVTGNIKALDIYASNIKARYISTSNIKANNIYYLCNKRIGVKNDNNK